MKKHGIEFHGVGAKRLHPEFNKVELGDDTEIEYDYLVIATGPEARIRGSSRARSGWRLYAVNLQDRPCRYVFLDFEELVANPGPVVVGAAPGASCFGPAYEYIFILDTELKKRKIRDKVPMHFVTPEPYIGHLGLDGVGDTKSLLESEFRNRHIHWTTNAKITEVDRRQDQLHGS